MACLFASTALAGDAIKASVSIPSTGPTPLITSNGSGYTPGTYAIGTIRLVYTVVANAFTPGDFAEFALNLENTSGYNGGQATAYPVTLNLVQSGSANLTLTPETAAFPVSSSAWQGTTDVKITIPPGVPSDDGTDLVGNLQLRTSPQGSHLDTVTTVQVHVRLVYPLAACLRTYDFITDESLAPLTPPISVQIKNGSIKSTQPGQLSDNVFVVNACPQAESFDLKMDLDPAFRTHPNGNPGNAVFTFVTLGTDAPTASTVASFASGTGTSHHQELCLPAITLQAGQTLLATVHMAINTSLAPSSLPADSFQYEASLTEPVPGGACGGGALSDLASPNPVDASLSYVLK